MSNDEMRLIDELRQRLDASYEEAAEAIRDAGGDMVQALAVVERRRRERGEGLVNISNELARKLRVKLGERPVAEISVTFGQAAAVVLSVAALLLSKLVIEVIRESPEAEQASA
jgi:hypothetical protein